MNVILDNVYTIEVSSFVNYNRDCTLRGVRERRRPVVARPISGLEIGRLVIAGARVERCDTVPLIRERKGRDGD